MIVRVVRAQRVCCATADTTRPETVDCNAPSPASVIGIASAEKTTDVFVVDSDAPDLEKLRDALSRA